MREPRYGRKRIRLPSYDYKSNGAYFVTICTARRAPLFEIPGYADIVLSEWKRSAGIRTEVSLDAFVVMPNHIHGIVWIRDLGASRNPVGAQGLAPLQPLSGSGVPPGPTRVLPRSLGSFVRGYKSAVTGRINGLRGTPRAPVWQRNYYEHVVRNEADLTRIREYIRDNPIRWRLDRENPDGAPDDYEIRFWEAYS